jgi:hypothetical protein
MKIRAVKGVKPLFVAQNYQLHQPNLPCRKASYILWLNKVFPMHFPAKKLLFNAKT